MLTCTLTTMFAAVLCTTAPHSDPPLLQQQRLELDLRIDYEAPSLAGTATLYLRNRNAVAVTQVPILLGRLMTLDSAFAVEGTRGRTRLEVINEVARFADWDALQVLYARVQLTEAVQPGDSLKLELRYHGRLVPYTETGMLYVRDHVDTAFTVIRSDAYAFPAVGVPRMAAIRAMPMWPFTYRVRITVPEGQVVASAGRLVERRSIEREVTWTYTSVGAVPFLNIPIARYHTVSNDVMEVFYLPGDSAGAAALLRAGTAGFNWLRDHYGTPHGAHRVTLMEIPDGWGSQADIHAGIILEASAFSLEARDYRELYHELSHLWNAPDAEAPSPRWNEGLAEYLKNRIAVELDGFQGTPQELARSRKRLCDRRQSTPLLQATALRDFGKHQLTNWSYRVGQLLFMELESLLGAPSFDAAYQQYYQSHTTRAGSVAALEAAFAARSPARVKEVFARWMHTTKGVDAYCAVARP